MRKLGLAVMLLAGNYILSKSLDIESFRPDPTLFQSVHGGVVEVLSGIQRPDVNVDGAINEIESLQAEVRERMGTSNMDTIRACDKQYLQEMIDRIDELINALEKTSPQKAVQLRSSCGTLKQLLD